MIKSVKLVTLVALSVLATSAFAQEGAAAGGNEGGTVALVDRSIVLPKGTGEVGLDLWIDLSKGNAGKAFYLSGNGQGSVLAGVGGMVGFDRYPGSALDTASLTTCSSGFLRLCMLTRRAGRQTLGSMSLAPTSS